MAATGIWLIRHGQSEANREGRWQGHGPTPLSALGRDQARELAARMELVPIDVIYSSDVLRARETARVVAERLGLDLRLDPRIREVDVGRLEGLLGAEAEARFPEFFQGLESAPGTTRRPGGESMVDVLRRAGEVLEAVADAHEGRELAMVSHGGWLQSAIEYVLALPAASLYGRFVTENTAVLRVEREDGDWAFVADSTHLFRKGWRSGGRYKRRRAE